MREALSKDEDGNFKYSIIVWSDIKKSAKSTIAAAVCGWMIENTDWGEIYIIANDLKQADTRVAHYLRRGIALSPDFGDGYRTPGNKIIASHKSFAEAIPIDPSGEAGSNADAIFFSELWGAHETAKQNMWAELTLSPTKFGQSFRWVESYAGFTEESELLYGLYDLGVKQGRLAFPDQPFPTTEGGDTVLEAYISEVEGARMFCLWNTQPRCPWQTKEYYASEMAVLTPNQFNRMHRNQWVTSEETFVPIEWWDACLDQKMPEITKNEPMIVAMDAAVSDDTFGLLMGGRHKDEENHVCVRYAKRWKPPKGGKIDFIGTKENPGPELELRRLIEEHNVIEVAYDPYQLHDLATRLSREGLAWFRPFSQTSDRLVADSELRDKIRDRHIHHSGEVDLREHIQNANAAVDKEDRKLRIVKRMSKLKVDLCVCLSMAVHEIMRLNL